jgi:hypothetical protein
MSNVERNHRRKQAGEWGVVEASAGQVGCPIWLAFWMELGAPGRISIEIDADRAANITPATWGRARRAFGLPARILVLDQETADRVRRVVPPRVEVVVAPDHPRLVEMAAVFALEDDVLELDHLPFPAPRARC